LSEKETVVIIGAGPAGLTAAYELSKSDKFEVIVFESEDQVGGISKTIDYKGNKIDIGGHRFFSKSDWVLDWWQQFLPIASNNQSIFTQYQNQKKEVQIAQENEEDAENALLVRPRKSRIYYNNHLFDYPLKLNFNTLKGIGLFNGIRIVFSLVWNKVFSIKNEKSLEDFYINRFGEMLYRIFFKDYTYKVWGKHCHEISAEWGRQRVKGLGIRKMLRHYLNTLFYPHRMKYFNKEVEQSLTEFFLYPAKGPGQMWQKVSEECRKKGITIKLNQHITKLGLDTTNKAISQVEVLDQKTSKKSIYEADYVLSSMPVKNLIESIKPKASADVFDIASKLEYRDFIIVGLLLDELELDNKFKNSINDNWLYIQDSAVSLGRVQLFHNWSPFMTANADTYWIGAEYFCRERDELWEKSDSTLIEFAALELENIGLIKKDCVMDGTVVRMPKAYPSYVGAYDYFNHIKSFTDAIDNLFLIGRNGMHKYNNQDHSMLTAREAVHNITNSVSGKDNIWQVNTEQDYHEEKDS